MTDDLFIAHNPAGVWQVPDTLRSIYSHAVEVGNPGRVLFISGQFGVAPDGSVATISRRSARKRWIMSRRSWQWLI